MPQTMEEVFAQMGIQPDEEELKHFGVKGMKWGKRKGESTGSSGGKKGSEVMLTKKLKNGGEITITRDPPPAIARVMSKISPTFKEEAANSHFFTMKNGKGEKVGDAQFTQDSPDSLNLAIITVKKAHRGNGYATAAMQGVVSYAQDKGLSKLTLEVPNNSPDAIHIYEKIGFVSKGLHEESSLDDHWGGLTKMEYAVPKKKSMKHAALDEDEIFEYIFRALEQMPSDDGSESNEEGLQMGDNTQADMFAALGIDPSTELAHYGVKGMRWGKRRSKSGSSSSTPKRTVKDMSDDELRTTITRLKLEKEFTQLTTPTPSAGKKAVQTMLANIAKQQAEAYVKKGMAEGGDLLKVAMNNRKK